MNTAIVKFNTFLAAAVVGAAFMMLGSSANAAQCRSGVDDAGDAVVICGSVAYYADDEGDDIDEGYDEDMHDEYGTLFVDPEDCEPGKYWMMDIDDEIPMPCN